MEWLPADASTRANNVHAIVQEGFDRWGRRCELCGRYLDPFAPESVVECEVCEEIRLDDYYEIPF